MRRLSVLASAFACDPSGESGLGTGEDILGWNIVNQIGRFHEVWVLASTLNERNVQESLRKTPRPHLHFLYFDLADPARRLLRCSRGGVQLYAYLWQIKACFVALRLHRKNRFDVFHHITFANDWMASFAGVLLPASFIRGPGGGTHPVPRAFFKTASFRKQAWEYIRITGRWLFRLDPFFILGHKKAKAILLCNRDAMEAVWRGWRKKTRLFPVNGITSDELSSLSAPSARRPSSPFTVLSAGRLLPLKGFSWAIRAFGRFAARCPDSEFRIYGEGPDHDALLSLIYELGLEGQVKLLPWVSRDKILAEMKTADVFLFPSLYDGGGAVVVEAMASGLPVICLDSGGPGFHIQGEWGIKIDPRNPEHVVGKIAAALQDLHSDRDLGRRLGLAARERVREYYLWDRLGDRLQSLYEDIL